LTRIRRRPDPDACIHRSEARSAIVRQRVQPLIERDALVPHEPGRDREQWAVIHKNGM